MEKKIIFLFLFIASISVHGQKKDSINRIDSQGRKIGLWKKMDESGKLKYVGFFKEGYPIGEFTYYYPSGKVKSVLVHRNKGKKSYAKLYYENSSSIMGEGLYINQAKDSLWKYYSTDAKIIREEYYKNKKPNGVWKTYYNNGIVFEETTYKDSIKEGVWKQNFENGNPKLEAKYINGKLEGGFKIYYPGGTLKLFGLYKNAMREGKWVTYKEDGKIEKTEFYLHGVLVESEAEYQKKQKELQKLFDTKLPDPYIQGSPAVPADTNNNGVVKPEDYY